MKSTIFTFLMFIGITAFSQSGNMVFFTEDGELFYVSLNGVKINTTPQANVKIEGAKAPGGMVTITFSDASMGTVKKNLPAQDGHEFTFKIKKNKKGEWKINYFTDVPLGSTTVANTTNNTASDQVLIQQKADPIVDQTVQNANTTNVQTTANPGNGGVSMNINMNGTQNQQTVTNTDVIQPVNTTTTTTNTTTTTVNTTQAENPKGISLNVNINGTSVNTALNNLSNSVTTTITGANTNSTTVNQAEPSILIDNNAQQQQQNNTTPVNNDVVVNQTTVSNTSSGCMMAMDASDFSAAKGSISSKSFEDSKMNIAKQITENNCLSVSQIKEVMGLFSFEQSKLDFAKFAYAYTTEKNNYYKVNDAFTFEASIDELQTYIKANK